MATGAELRELEWKMREDAREDLVHTNGGIGANLLIYKNGRGLKLVGSMVSSDAPSKRDNRRWHLTFAGLLTVSITIGAVFAKYDLAAITHLINPLIIFLWIKAMVGANGEVITTDGREFLIYFQDNVDRIWHEESQKLLAADHAARAQVRAEIDRKMRED